METVVIEESVREYWKDGDIKYVHIGFQSMNKSLKDKVGACEGDLQYTTSPDAPIAEFMTYARQEIVNAANALDNGMTYV